MAMLAKKCINLFQKRAGAIHPHTLRLLSTSSQLRAKVKVDDLNIHYRKVGKGPHVVLCCPGFVGSVQESILPFVKKMNQEEFTFIAWDPPGYGRSRPPVRNVKTDEFALITDATIVAKLMKELGYEKYSVIGHSNGGVTGLVLAGRHPEIINKLVVCNAPFCMNTRAVKVVEMMRELEMWTPEQRASLRRVYETDYFMKLCDDWRAVIDKESKEPKIQLILLEIFMKIKAPTLYIQGKQDLIVPIDEGDSYVKLIKTSRLVQIPEGGHDHLEFLEDFVTLSQNFLLE